jgi:hypothetical protein
VTCAVRYAAELEIFPPRQGSEDFDRAPLQVEVTLGQGEFKESPSGIDVGFTLRFRRVIVELALDNAELALDGRYNRTLSSELFKQSVRRTLEDTSNRGRERGGGVGLKLNAILSFLSLDGAIRSKLEEELKRGNFASVESAPPFQLVRYASGRRWEIGHTELGDPTQLDGALRGSYLTGEPEADDGYCPLCYIVPLEPRPYSVTVELRASLRDCVYSPLGMERDEARWKQTNRRRIEGRLIAKMLQEQNRHDGHEPPPDEIILARGRIDFSMDSGAAR